MLPLALSRRASRLRFVRHGCTVCPLALSAAREETRRSSTPDIVSPYTRAGAPAPSRAVRREPSSAGSASCARGRPSHISNLRRPPRRNPIALTAPRRQSAPLPRRRNAPTGRGPIALHRTHELRRRVSPRSSSSPHTAPRRAAAKSPRTSGFTDHSSRCLSKIHRPKSRASIHSRTSSLIEAKSSGASGSSNQ